MGPFSLLWRSGLAAVWDLIFSFVSIFDHVFFRIAPDASSFFLNTPISAGDVLTSWLRPGDLILRTVTLWIDVSGNIVLAGLRPALNYIL